MPQPTPCRFHSWLFVDPACEAWFAALGCRTLADFADCGRQHGRQVAGGNHIAVWRTPLSAAGQDAVLYIKRYIYEDKPRRYWGRLSRACNEYRSYQAFAAMGIPGPDAVAVGETRSWRGLHQALVVTREIPDTRNLEQILPDPGFANSAALRAHLLTEVAALAARAHRQGFFHLDLKARNILVQGFPAADCRLHWIDCPKGGYWRISRLPRAITDLTDVAEDLFPALTVEEHALFVAAYLKERPDLSAGAARVLTMKVLRSAGR